MGPKMGPGAVPLRSPTRNPRKRKIKPPLQGEHDFQYYRCPQKPLFLAQIPSKTHPKTNPKTGPFPEPCFFRFGALEAVLRRPKTKFSKNYRKTGTPIWAPFSFKIVKNGATVIKCSGFGAGSASMLAPGGTQDRPGHQFYLQTVPF